MYSIPPSRIPHLPPPAEEGSVLFREEETLNLREYWIIIRKYRWTIVVFLLPIIIIGAMSAALKPRTYTATATLYFELQAPNIVGSPELSLVAERTFDSYYKTQVDLLLSRSLAAQVLLDLGLDKDERFQANVAGPPSWSQRFLRPDVGSVVRWLRETSPVKWIHERFTAVREGDEEEGRAEAFEFGVHPDLIDGYLKHLGISHENASQLVKVRFTSLNPSFSRDLANAHATTFIRKNLQTRFEETTEARQFLEGKLVELKAALEKSEAELNRFRKKHAIVSLEQGQNLVLARLNALNADLIQARTKRIELESIVHAVQQRDNQALSQVIDNPLIQNMKNQISTLELEQGRLATVFNPTHPQMMALQEQIGEAKNRMDQEIRRVVRSIISDYNAAKAREAALTNAMEEQRQRALDLREKAIEASILEREVEANQALYTNVLRRTKETNLSQPVPTSNVRVIDRAETPTRPDSAKRMTILILTALVGLLGGVGLAFLRHYLDNTLKTPEDIARFLRLPTLSMVPDIRRLDRRIFSLRPTRRIPLLRRPPISLKEEKGGLVTAFHPLSLISESYQALCTALLFSLPERAPRTILITSSQPQEGKTVTAINIAATLARNGAPVLLIDADLRKGRCHGLLGLENESGLANVLTGNRNATEVIKKTAFNNLYLLSRGERAPNPAVLLGSMKMGQLLESLQADFPFIILDSAPLLPISDTVLLSTKVDGVLLVAKAQAISRYAARQACDRLTYVKAKILGVVLNSIDMQGPEYNEFRDSYVSYYHGYATGNERKGRRDENTFHQS
jgi:succinoglycan biosynthesis transport protein ExoP